MTKHSSIQNIFLLSSIMLALSIGLATSEVFAAEGDVLSTLNCAGGGVGVGFDGTLLYWMDFGGSVLHRCTTAGVALSNIPISGASGITVISWDATRAVFWGINSSRDVYTITNTGTATFKFNAAAVFGSSLHDGIAFDASDDSLWISPDVSSTMFHYKTDGTFIGSFPIPTSSGCGNSGVAAGSSNILYLGFNGCNLIQRHDKSLNFQASFPIGTGRTEDLECDNITFSPKDAIWTKDAFDTDLIAFEVQSGTCTFGGGGPPVVERPAVGGSILPIDISALLITGAFTNAIWMAPVLAGAAGATAFYLKTRKN